MRGDAFPSRGGAFGWSGVLRLAVIAAIGVLAVGGLRYLVQPAPSTVGGPSSLANAQVQQSWPTEQGVAMTIQRQDPTDRGLYYWRAVTYDHDDLTGWSQTDSTTVVRQPDAQLFDGLADGVDPTGLDRFTFTVTPGDYKGPLIMSPGIPFEVDQTTRLTSVADTGYIAKLQRVGGSGPYRVTALASRPPAPRDS